MLGTGMAKHEPGTAQNITNMFCRFGYGSGTPWEGEWVVGGYSSAIAVFLSFFF